MRRSYIERIFEALRILYHRPIPQDFPNALTDLNRDELDLMDTERSDMLLDMWPCDECKDIPANVLLEELRQHLPWFISPSSYAGCVETLLTLLRQVEVNIRVDGDRPGCNQLRHFCKKLSEKVANGARTS